MTTEQTIEPYKGGYSVFEHGTYEDSSVLAGQNRRIFQNWYETIEDAVAEYPDAMVPGHRTNGAQVMTSLAPDDFDPIDA